MHVGSFWGSAFGAFGGGNRSAKCHQLYAGRDCRTHGKSANPDRRDGGFGAVETVSQQTGPKLTPKAINNATKMKQNNRRDFQMQLTNNVFPGSDFSCKKGLQNKANLTLGTLVSGLHFRPTCIF